MKEKKKIFCPRCHRAVAIYDGKQTINPIAKCKKCKKLVVYHVDTGKTELKKLPQRNTSSGMSFC